MSVSVVLVFFLWVFIWLPSQASSPKAEQPVLFVDGIIATVNNEPILQSDRTLLNLKLSRGEMIDDLALGMMNLEEIKNNANLALKYLIRTKMLDSEVKRLKLEVTSDRLEQELKDIAKRNGISRNLLPQALEAQGMIFSDYQDYLKTRLERQSLIDQEVSSKLKISDDDLMAAYYNKYNKNPSNSFQVDLSQIFFNPKKGGLNQAKSRAELVFDRLKQGHDFKKMASQYSEDDHFQNQGHLGEFNKSDLESPISNAIEKHQGSGLIPHIIKTKRGFHIFFINSRHDIPDEDFLKKRELLRGELFEKQMRFALDRWFESNLSSFTITYHEPPQGSLIPEEKHDGQKIEKKEGQQANQHGGQKDLKQKAKEKAKEKTKKNTPSLKEKLTLKTDPKETLKVTPRTNPKVTPDTKPSSKTKENQP
jgi:peptidyl-prolyl cis-trans isomerase SurA